MQTLVSRGGFWPSMVAPFAAGVTPLRARLSDGPHEIDDLSGNRFGTIDEAFKLGSVDYALGQQRPEASLFKMMICCEGVSKPAILHDHEGVQSVSDHSLSGREANSSSPR